MDDVLAGLEHGAFDAAIGAITITPERLTRVDFSYPTHRSGVAVAVARQASVLAALAVYGVVARQLGLLILAMLLLLLVIGVLIWVLERRSQTSDVSETTIGKLHEGLYWAVVTMTTVGYGDKAPKTRIGRAVAVIWMMSSLVLVSLLSTSIVAQVTTERVNGSGDVRPEDLKGKRLGAAAVSSGAEYLKTSTLPFKAYPTLGAALDALDAQEVDAVINSVGALEYTIAEHHRGTIRLKQGLLAPAYLGVALPRQSPIKALLDQSLVRITTAPEWPAIESAYFGH